ncbi:acyl carrier protein [Nocardia beijingensis]|uniref:acyl carrier protein n=1 Tax=Nocardia beijingensis TaxID=95162 RepID=UPI00189391D7|nr:acyl carrier protein [Nocardia beijingensis]MBF6073059.1 acyl carrier protein [Nocardia beijingensis]
MDAAETVSAHVRALFAGVLHVPQIDMDIPLLDYGLDSIRSVEVVVELEQRFGIAISDEEAATLYTARDVAEHVVAKTSGSRRAALGAQA